MKLRGPMGAATLSNRGSREPVHDEKHVRSQGNPVSGHLRRAIHAPAIASTGSYEGLFGKTRSQRNHPGSRERENGSATPMATRHQPEKRCRRAMVAAPRQSKMRGVDSRRREHDSALPAGGTMPARNGCRAWTTKQRENQGRTPHRSVIELAMPQGYPGNGGHRPIAVNRRQSPEIADGRRHAVTVQSVRTGDSFPCTGIRSGRTDGRPSPAPANAVSPLPDPRRARRVRCP